jgi:hypothetical protein
MTEDRHISVDHLQMIQGVIARQANNSFLIKGWALTVSSALSGFALDKARPSLAGIGLGAIVLFWSLDSYFLYIERRYRCLFDAVRKSDSLIEPFSMDTKAYKETTSWMRSWTSMTLMTFYGIAALGTLAVVLVSQPTHCG